MNEKAIIETVKTAQPKLSREDLLQVLKYRYATKAWDRNRKIRDEDMQTILEAARLAPTSFGFEPWKIIVLQDQEIRQAIRPYAWGADAALQDASHFLVFLARKKSGYHLRLALSRTHHARHHGIARTGIQHVQGSLYGILSRPT